MPNWVRNRVIALDTNALHEHLLDENGNVDFNKLIPMPKDLEITSGSYSYEIPSRFFKEEFNKRVEAQQPADNLLQALYNDTITQEEFTEKAKSNDIIVKTIMKIKDWHTRKSKSCQYPMSKETLNEALDTFIKGISM